MKPRLPRFARANSLCSINVAFLHRFLHIAEFTRDSILKMSTKYIPEKEEIVDWLTTEDTKKINFI
ncbi:hypothetical protein DPMN_137290 [Dreissena polymorpha]|uniref:Uncharacterized protein n=1 Tax=Dreissena polymorpha TaxID=45954 RepID=A0A9D4G1M2_DREPO|nr:hypothetical protein DPMN_137290 [Dreissena polymorpha]